MAVPSAQTGVRPVSFNESSSEPAFLLRFGWRRLPHPIRWLVVAIAGGAVTCTGVVLLVLPGPGIPLILFGLVILATEFAWAQRTLHHVRHRSNKVLAAIARRSTRRES